MKATATALLAVSSMLWSSVALAQGLEFPVDNFRPAASAKGYYVTENGTVLGHLHPSFQLLGVYSSRPLQLVDTDTDDRVADIIKSRIDADLLMAIGFFDVLELGVVLPFTIHQDAQNLALLDRPADSELSGGLRDLRVIPKVKIASTDEDIVSVALALPLSVPTGSGDDLLGNDGVAFAPTLIFAIDSEYFDLALNGGYRLRKDQSFGFTPSEPKVAIGPELFGSVGTKIALGTPAVELVGDLFVSTSVDEQDVEETPLEVLGGVRVHIEPGIVINAGGGPGLTRGIGAPAYRLLFGIGFESIEDPDPDGDGIPTKVDACPQIPEDFDKFEDDDGCPELDNDKDGVLDADDKCPNEPEDRDGFEDANGCPDPDNDKDGIPDASDKCPNEPEDFDKFEDADGCPDLDNDKDGVLDPDDKCPVEPEDRDGFEDADGCADPDNDKDGVPDASDKCPNDPEDKDNFEDADGCPDPDNDGDGILDPTDKCPLEPEIFNGNEDEDGCPDKAKGPVQIEHGKITAPPVFFATGKDVILSQSFPILEQVARTFRENPWVKRVRVEGHTDDRGDDGFNMDLSQRRADSVRRFLIERGVAPERLEATGYGETQPVTSNRTSKGRAKNRRVEFIILDPPQTQVVQ